MNFANSWRLMTTLGNTFSIISYSDATGHVWMSDINDSFFESCHEKYEENVVEGCFLGLLYI